ncbi:AAA family ATPase [Kitasatospora sp. NPDC096140]|uniref:ATP-binding protein n=1 Tax=Kitasatospora sp. NPDC096140 TaxID=3155425 RepID=UPI00333059EA
MTRSVGRDNAPTPRWGFALVGRDRELGLLLDALRHPPAVAVLEGEGGIGKSRLVREATAALAAEGRPVLAGSCHPLREPFPYGPVVDALRGVGALLPATERIPATAGALAELLPDVADRLPPPPPAPHGPLARQHRIVLGVRSLLAAIGPAVLVVEDLHWADEATRELLLLLARDLPGRLSLLLTVRTEDLPPGTPALGAAYRRPPGVGGTTIALERLTGPDVRALAEAVLGHDATPELGAALYERSQGLPLVVEEDLRTLRDEGAGRDLVGRLRSARVPAGLSEAVIERLDALPPNGTSIAAAAAVLAVPGTEAVLAAVAGLDPEPAADGLTAALRAAVLAEAEPGHYGFRHVLAQQVAHRHVPGPSRVRLHERAVRVLRAQTPAPLVRIAHHTLATGDRRAWLDRAQDAVRESVALGDDGTAARLLRQILDAPELPDARRAEAALTLAGITVNGVDFSASAGRLRLLLDDPRLPVAVRGEIRFALGVLATNQGGDRTGFQDLERAVDELATRPDLVARVLSTLALDERDGATALARSRLDRADLVLLDSTDEVARATVRATRLTVLARDADPGIWPLLDRLPREGEDTAVLAQTARALFNAASGLIMAGHDRRAAPLLAESLELAERLGLTNTVCFGRFALLHFDFFGGHWSGLAERLAALRAEYPEMAPLAEVKEELLLGQLASAQGKFGRAVDHLRTASARAGQHAQVGYALNVAAGLATVRLAQDEPGKAYTAAVPAVASLREAGTWAQAIGLVPAAVDAALRTGHRDVAEGLAGDVEAGLAGRDAPAAEAELALARGLLLLEREPDAAAGHFADAHRIRLGIGRPYDCARAAEHLGRALAQRRPEEAGGYLAQALDGFTRLGASADAARCGRAVRGLGLARPEPSSSGRGYGDRLSPREQQVAELLARGATNHDIARALVLSQRTVEKHVAQVLRKLGTVRRNVGKVFPGGG